MLGEAVLDEEVYVLVIEGGLDLTGLVILQHLGQTGHQAITLLRRQHPLAGQHAGMGLGPGDVRLDQPDIETDAGIEAGDRRVQGFFESLAPGLGGGVGLGGQGSVLRHNSPIIRRAPQP